MTSKAQSTSETNKAADRRILAQAECEERGVPANGSREHYEAWQAEQERRAEAEATGSPELVALRKLAHTAAAIFEFQGIMSNPLTPLEILGEALRCAQSDLSVIGDASHAGSGVVDSMVFRRAELRLDLALALAEYREEFSQGGAQ